MVIQNTPTKIDKIASLRIGQRGENLATDIKMDVSDWITVHPDASYYCLFKRPDEVQVQPVLSSLEDDVLTWTVRAWECAVIGVGYLEVRAVNPDTGLVAKSRVIPCAIEDSVIDDEGPVPPEMSWVGEVLAAKDTAVAAKTAAEGARDTAQTTVAGAIAGIQAEGQTQVGVVQAEGTTQVGAVQSEGTTQVGAVQAKGEETLASIPSDYTELSDDVTELKSAIGGIDLSWTTGYILQNNGNAGSYSIYSTTDYFMVYGSKVYLKTYVAANNAYLVIAFYNADKTFISGVSNGGASSNTYEGQVTIPENAVYARVSCRNADLETTFELRTYDFIRYAMDELSAIKEQTEKISELDNVKSDVAQNTADIASNSTNISVLSDRVHGENSTKTLTKVASLNFAENATKYSDSGAYETHYAKVKAGYTYTWRFVVNSGGRPSVRFAFAEAIPAKDVPATKIHDEQLVDGSFEWEYVPQTDGYLSVSVYHDSLNNTTTTLTQFLEGIIPTITAIDDRVIRLEKAETNVCTQKLYYEPESLEQYSVGVRMTQWTSVPHDHASINVKCPPGICVWFTLMLTPYDRSEVVTDYYGDGDIVELTAGYNLYKVFFAYGEKNNDIYVLTGEKLLLETVVDLIGTNLISLTYHETGVIINNKDIEKKYRAIIGDGANAAITHISDTHGDAIRYLNFLEMSRFIGATCAINSGDFVNNHVGDGYSYLLSGIEKYPDVSTIICIGNHDAVSLNETAYTRFYKPFDDAYDYSMAQSNVYFYKDYPSKNLRVISLDIYEERHNGSNCCISSDQINWLINTLSSVPAEYGVIIVAHSSEDFVDKLNDYETFYSKGISSDWTNVYSGIDGRPVRKIVDAFISRTSISDSYTQTVLTAVGESTTESVTVTYSADFTAVPASAEFIAYINGHKHKDMVGYLNGATNRQLVLNVTHGCSSKYYADQDDFPRADGKGSVQDAFNLYVIDRTNKCVKIVRFGANVTYDLTLRDYMSIPYAETV